MNGSEVVLSDGDVEEDHSSDGSNGVEDRLEEGALSCLVKGLIDLQSVGDELLPFRDDEIGSERKKRSE